MTGRLIRVFTLLALATQMTVAAAQPDSAATGDAYPPGELGKVVRLGEEIVNRTKVHPLSKAYVGNALNCTSCHLDNGRHESAGSFLGTATAYPAWSPREQRVITLEDRVLNCFMRSENGLRPPVGSRVSVAVTTYITWLSSGERIAMNPEKPLGPRHVRQLDISKLRADAQRGKALYVERCADCHQEDGAGGDDGPPVWGAQSYNDGAGLSNNRKLASWLKVAMPLDDATLSVQEALDIATYVNAHDREKFVLSEHLPPPERRGAYNGKLESSAVNPSEAEGKDMKDDGKNDVNGDVKALVGEWLIEDIEGRGVIDYAQTTIKLGEDGAVSGSTGVNRYSSKATIEGHKIKFGAAPMTRRAGPPAVMDQESKFIAALAKVQRYRVDEERQLLFLLDGEDEVLLRGSRME